MYRTYIAEVSFQKQRQTSIERFDCKERKGKEGKGRERKGKERKGKELQECCYPMGYMENRRN